MIVLAMPLLSLSSSIAVGIVAIVFLFSLAFDLLFVTVGRGSVEIGLSSVRVGCGAPGVGGSKLMTSLSLS